MNGAVTTMIVEDPVRLRVAGPADSEQISAIWRDGIDLQKWPTGIPPHQQAVEWFAQRLSKPMGDSKIFVAESGGRLVGWQSLMDLGATQITRALLSSTYTDRDWHRRGIARRLLSHAMEDSRGTGCSHIVGWIRADNLASIRLVQSLGWTFVGDLPKARESDIQLGYYAYAIP